MMTSSRIIFALRFRNLPTLQPQIKPALPIRASSGYARTTVGDTSLRATRLLMELSAACLAVGCCQVRPQPRAASAAPASQPASTPAAADTRATFRFARAADLRIILIARSDPASRYPLCTVQVYNNSEEDVIVGYEPGSVVVHCGEYERRGPAPTFVSRREILRPNQPVEFELPAGGWSRSPSAEPQELLIPTRLPPGGYPLWATFQPAAPTAGQVQSERDTYRVEEAKGQSATQPGNSK